MFKHWNQSGIVHMSATGVSKDAIWEMIDQRARASMRLQQVRLDDNRKIEFTVDKGIQIEVIQYMLEKKDKQYDGDRMLKTAYHIQSR
jgi:hypothetical protein